MGFLDFALEQPKYFDFAFMVPSRNIKQLPEELTRQNWATFQVAIEQVSQCMRDGVFKEDDPMGTTIMLWASAHGLITLHRMQRFGPDPALFKTIFHSSIDRLLNGLKP